MEAKILTHKSGKPIRASCLYGRCWDYRDKPRIRSRWKRLRQMYAWVRDRERLAWRRQNDRWGMRKPDPVLSEWYREQTGYKHPGRFVKDMLWFRTRQRIWIELPVRYVNYEWMKGPMPTDRMFRVLMATAAYKIIHRGLFGDELRGKVNELAHSGTGGGGSWEFHHDHYGTNHTVRMHLWRLAFHERVYIEARVSDENMHRYVEMVAKQLFPEMMADQKDIHQGQLTLF